MVVINILFNSSQAFILLFFTEHKQLLENAKVELKKSKRKDYYKILGVSKTASQDEIKKAYRKRALLHHPDRHSNSSDGEKKDQECKFKELGEAYNILSDPKKRARYDNGYDDDGTGMTDIDPTNIFNTFFNMDARMPGYNNCRYNGHNAGAFSFHFP